MLAQNPLRTDFQQQYENLVSAYSRERDRPKTERAFEALLKFVAGLAEEQERAVRGLRQGDTRYVYPTNKERPGAG